MTTIVIAAAVTPPSLSLQKSHAHAVVIVATSIIRLHRSTTCVDAA